MVKKTLDRITMDYSRQQRTKEKMLSLAMNILAKDPKASMNDIAEAADVGRATLFRYFKSRKQLVIELIGEAKQRLDTATRPILEKNLGAGETLERIIKVLVPLGASFHFLSFETIHSGNDAIEAIYDNQLILTKELSTRLKTEGIVASDIPVAWVAAVLDNLIYTAWVTISEGDIAPNEAPGLVLKTFLKGVAPT